MTDNVVQTRETVLDANWDLENYETWRRKKPATKHSRKLIEEASMAAASPMTISTQDGDIEISNLTKSLVEKIVELEAKLYAARPNTKSKKAVGPGAPADIKEELLESKPCEACKGLGSTEVGSRTKRFIRTCVTCGGTGNIRIESEPEKKE